MIFAEAVSLSGEVILLALLALLLALLACVSVVVGTVVAARRHARTGSTASAVVALLGATIELYVLAVTAVELEPVGMAISGGALAAAGVAYAVGKRRPPAT